MEISQEEKNLFPIESVDGLIKLFELHLNKKGTNNEPNLALLSIILGYVEYNLTLSKVGDQSSSSAESDAELIGKKKKPKGPTNNASAVTDEAEHDENSEHNEFPKIELDIIEPLYLKFSILMKGLVDKSLSEHTTDEGFATRILCKKVSDILWNRLNPHYHKDKAHIQSLYSFLIGRQLDCFGLAFAVTAACQILHYDDVHLVLSEDHAWVLHGNREETEITWHGKVTEDKRGYSVNETNTEKSWIYLNGNAMTCSRMEEVASMIVAINPAIDLHTESRQLFLIQYRLLELIYRIGALDRYPMGLGLLADLVESSPHSELPSPESLHLQAVKCTEEKYNNHHVYSYCSQGHFYSRIGQAKKAVKCWSQAAQVLASYNYTREDEEVYKEIMEIAGELIPQTIRTDPNVNEDRECFMDLIRLYDGICLWEEGSPTPVLHSWWAKYFTQSLGHFTSEVRKSFARTDNDSDNEDKEGDKEGQETVKKEIASRKSKRHSMKVQETLQEESRKDEAQQPSILGVKSVKMRGLEELLVCGKKINGHTVSLQLTAQSQVHFVKRRSNASDYSIEYSERGKRQRRL